MKRKWPVFLFLAVALASLLMPAVSLHVHSQLGEETAALFPPSLSLGQLIFRGSSALPVSAVPAMEAVSFGGWMAAGSLILLLIAALLTLLPGRGKTGFALGASLASLCLGGAFASHLANLSSSLYFSMLISTQFSVWIPAVMALGLAVYLLIGLLKAEKEAEASDAVSRRFRLAAAVSALAALCMFLLPVYTVAVPASFTESASDAASLNRSVSLFSAALGSDTMLSTERQDGKYASLFTGEMEALEQYSSEANNIRGIFQIPESSSTLSANPALIASAVLLLLTILLALIPSVDKWFPTAAASLAVLTGVASALNLVSFTQADMYTGAARQLVYLGLGEITPVPMLMIGLSAAAAVFGVLSIRRANAPYFVNPIPKKRQLQVVAVCLALIAVVSMLLPAVSMSFYKPGKTQVQSTAQISGLDLLKLSAPEDVSSPKDKKGAAMYSDEADDGVLTASAVAGSMNGLVRTMGVTGWFALALTLAGCCLVCLRKNRRLAITLFLLAFVLRLVSWLAVLTGMPKAVGTASCTVFFYLALPALVFAAFFANFMHQEELPKKYKLFLMMLPFLVAVLLFSYLPLYGWSYAFFNYKFGQPLSDQEFVGFKWFSEMWTNPANRENIVRVLKNTFGMSGLNLLTSWLPMVFAIFLNEVANTRFKKFVQIFTTLPNFISWALVFSFAMCLFAMDTGIWSKFMLGIGAIKEPVVWLNSPDHIWLKMWGWSTWKGLGWGAIMYLAAISGIDQELYEAARVDGANRWHQMRYITLPGLLPTFFVLLMLSISNILNNGMDQYLVFQNPMNKATIEVLDLYVYNITIASRGTTLYSFATAIGILKTLVSVTLLFTANFASKKLRGESIV